MDTALIYSEAMKLPIEARWELVDRLTEGLDGVTQAEIERSQVAEVQDRWAAYQRGELKAVDWDTAMAELMQRHAP
jgi:putative addiction module component (TIGR02574 family)